MTLAQYHMLFWVFAAWIALVMVKAIRALGPDKIYTFSMWDGGMIRAGKSLTRLGTKVKVVTASLLCASSVAFASGVLLPTMWPLVIGAAVASVVCDFAFAA
jgi:hypothetical protein